MRLLLLSFVVLLAGCAAPDPSVPTPPPIPTNATAAMVAAPVEIAVSLVEGPGVGVPPTTLGIEPSTLQMAIGVPVKLIVTNDGASAHDLVIEGIDVATESIPAGESAELLFTPTEAGTYKMYCSIGGSSAVGHDARGMHGEVVVA